MDDKDIIELYFARSERAIEETARSYQGYCYAIASRILPFQEDAEECLNDTWMRAWNAIPPERPDNLKHYLGRITRNLALNRCRDCSAGKRGSGVITEALEEIGACIQAPDNVEQSIVDASLTALLNRFLASLKPEARKLFVRRYWYLDSIADLAARYHMSESKVKMSLLRTRKKLKSILQEERNDEA